MTFFILGANDLCGPFGAVFDNPGSIHNAGFQQDGNGFYGHNADCNLLLQAPVGMVRQSDSILIPRSVLCLTTVSV